MNINRKIQLAAAAVIANGALALGLVTPVPALASTCPNKLICAPVGACQDPVFARNECQLHASPGCTAVSGECAGARSCTVNGHVGDLIVRKYR